MITRRSCAPRVSSWSNKDEKDLIEQGGKGEKRQVVGLGNHPKRVSVSRRFTPPTGKILGDKFKKKTSNY